MNARRQKCPICGKAVEWTEASRWRPFCSERCRLIDLGAWAQEEYRIPGKHKGPSEPGGEPEEDRPHED